MRNWNIETRKGGVFPAQSGIGASNPDIVIPSSQQPLPSHQILASFTKNVSVSIPALQQNVATTLNFFVPIDSFPSPFRVKTGTTAIIQANMTLTQSPADAATSVQPPSLSLSIGSGGSQQSGGTWTLPAGAYQAPRLNASVSVLTTDSGVGAQTVVFTVTAQLLGTATVLGPTKTVSPGITATKSTGNPTVPQATVVTLASGTFIWVYPAPYTGGTIPVITATPYGTPVSGTPEIWIGSVTNTQASINSTDATDHRQVGVIATLKSA